MKGGHILMQNSSYSSCLSAHKMMLLTVFWKFSATGFRSKFIYIHFLILHLYNLPIVGYAWFTFLLADHYYWHLLSRQYITQHRLEMLKIFLFWDFIWQKTWNHKAVSIQWQTLTNMQIRGAVQERQQTYSMVVAEWREVSSSVFSVNSE